MIGKLTGKIVYEDIKGVIIDVNGVGYKLGMAADALALIHGQKSEISVWTYLAVRENALDMYGFIEKEELEFFELINTVSGIGPKKALGILSLAPVKVLRDAITKNDASYLTKVSGIGRKVAEKVVLELQDKIGTIGESLGETSLQNADTDVLEAVKSLGYSLQEARDAIKRISPEVTGVNERIKEALRQIGK
ncbi:MAG: Holliday junction branch migration protein RuvA [Candidatus Vogelbacteria bacterium]|nr:Holliday junction branch migration protein RuvA [Candidatus Vogelbacteria bacterium]